MDPIIPTLECSSDCVIPKIFEERSLNTSQSTGDSVITYSVGDELIYKGPSEFYRLPPNFGFPDNYQQYEQFNEQWGGNAVDRFIKEKNAREAWRLRLDKFLSEGNSIQDCFDEPVAKKSAIMEPSSSQGILKFVYLSHNALPITKAYPESAGYDFRRYKFNFIPN